MKLRNGSLWHDRKRTFLGLPWSFTKYELTGDRLFITRGFFTTIVDEVKLYRIVDTELSRTLGQKLFGLGSIMVCSKDRNMKDFEIKNIKKSADVCELLSQTVEKVRDEKHVVSREIIDGCGDDDDGDDD